MKKLSIFLFICISTISSLLAQGSNVNKANASLYRGKYQEAIGYINQAIEHPKSKEKARTWYVRGEIYKNIASKEIASTKDLLKYAKDTSSQLMTAIKSYQYIIDHQKSGNIYRDKALFFIDSMYKESLSIGAKYYNEKNYEKAGAYMALSSTINSLDTISTWNAVISFSNISQAKEVRFFCNRMLERGAKRVEIQNQIANTYITEINKFREEKKIPEAIESLNKAIELMPSNTNLHFVLGVLYQDIDQTQKALLAFDKAISLDEKHYNALVNSASIYYNDATEVQAKYNNLSPGELKSEKGQKMKNELMSLYKKALPYFEKIEVCGTQPSKKVAYAMYSTFLACKKTAAAEKAKKLYDTL